MSEQTQDSFLEEFLSQQGEGSKEVKTNDIIIDGGTDDSETIEQKDPSLIPNKELEITNELPDGFEPAGDESQEDNENNSIEKVDKSQYSFKALANYLSEEGLIDFQDSDDLEDNEDVLKQSVKTTIEKEISAYKNSIPEKAKQLIEYIEKGGDVDSYLTKLQKPFDIKNVDLTSESEQEKVVREYLKNQEYSQEEIDETIDDYKDSLILEKQAKVATKQLQKHYDKIEQSLIEEQEAIEESRKEQYTQYISNVNTVIDSSDTLAGLPLTNKEKLDFKRYLLTPDKEGLTQYAREVAENPVQTQLELAYLKYMKYDFSKAMKKGETLATQRIKNIFKANETSIKTGKSVNEASDETGSLDAFKSFLGKK